MYSSKVKKNHLGALTLGGLILASLAACTSGDQIKKAIENDPTIVFAAIEKDPEKFIEVVNKAAQEAQRKAGERAKAEEASKRDAEFANPLKPVIQEGRPILGPKDAKVTIVEYSDFQCPWCARGYDTIRQVMEMYPNDVRLVFKHLPFQKHSMIAAKYFEAIALQNHNKAWDFKGRVFKGQDNLRNRGEDFLKELVRAIGGIDQRKLAADLESKAITSRINADMEEAQSFDITGTPGFIVNGVSLRGAYPVEEFKRIIDRHLKGS